MFNILYVVNIFGDKIIKTRNIKKNLSFAGTTKAKNIAFALQKLKNHVYFYSPGSPAENKFKWYNSTKEIITNHASKKICIQYGFAFDCKFIRGIINFLSTLFYLPRMIIKNSINVIIVYNLTFINILIIIFAKLLSLKVILEYEDRVIESREKYNNKIKSFFLFYEFIASKLVDGIFAPTKTLTLHHKNRALVPGIIGDDINFKNLKLKKITNKFNKPLKIIYSGRFDKSKGIDLFLEALNDINLKIEMIVCGNGPLEKNIKNLCFKNKHRINFVGPVSRKKLIQFLNWADVGINPHLNIHKGGSWPFKVIEYLGTCGTVFSNKTDDMPNKLSSKLFLYKGNNSKDIREAFHLFLKKWPKLRQSSKNRKAWAIEEYSPQKVGRQIFNLM